MATFYGFFINLGERLSHGFLLFVRLFWGIQFAYVGWQKLQNLGATTANFTSAGLPDPALMASVVGYIELICGIAMAVGFLSRIATLPLIITMLVALFTVHKAFLTAPLNVIHEAPFNFLMASLTVFCFGPGRLSLDQTMMKAK